MGKYADVLVNFALGSGVGVRPGEVVQLRVPEAAKPLLKTLHQAVIKAGAHPLVFYTPDGINRGFYELASDEQLSFFPERFMKGVVDQIDHTIAILAETDKRELDGIDSKKIMAFQKAHKPYMDWRREKESAGKYTWTLAMYGTQAMAEEVNMSLEEYWGEIINACYLEEANPSAKWAELHEAQTSIKAKLDALPIDKLRIEAEGTDLWIFLGEKRRWLGGSGRNIPSFELFVSPDWRGAQGCIQFTEPLYRYGNLIEGAYLEFENGRVVKATAQEGEQVLKDMIAVENADKIGEFSLTDRKFSRITKFMGETLFDENVGGAYGNTHVALGSAYRDSYDGDPASISEEGWKELGFNNSVVHTDIVATSNRVVTAFMKDGSSKVIYRDGSFEV